MFTDLKHLQWREQRKLYRQRYPEKVKEAEARYLSNPEKLAHKRAYRRAWAKRNQQRLRERAQRWRQANPEKVREQQLRANVRSRLKYWRHRDKYRLYYALNRDSKLAKARVRYQRDRALILAKQNAKYHSDPEHRQNMNARCVVWRLMNKEKQKALASAYYRTHRQKLVQQSITYYHRHRPPSPQTIDFLNSLQLGQTIKE